MPHMPQPGLIRRMQPIWPYVIAAVAIGARVLPAPRTIDDAFITFRYARNLLAGLGFVFNPGERVLGTTTPLDTLLLAGLSAVTGSRDYPWLALGLNAVADGLTCLALVRLAQALGARRGVGLATALLWAIAPMSVTFAIGGMETSVFILLLVLTALWYVTGHGRRAALAAALLLLTRPDGALLVAPLALDYALRQWRARRWRAPEAGVFLGALVPWALFASLYFGSPIPHSIAAKTVAYRLPADAALVRLIQHYGTPFFEERVLGRYWPLAGLALYLALSLVGGLRAVRHNARAWPVAIFPWVYFVAYAAAHPLIFRWYLAPPLPFYFLLIGMGASHLLYAAFGRRATRPARMAASAGGVLAVAAAVGLSLNAWTWRPDHGPQHPAPEMAWHQLELYYAEVGQALRPAVTPQTVIAAGDVGALGYYSGARILDTVGLMSPQAARYYPLDPGLYVINYAIAPGLILDERPDYVVLLEAYGRGGLLKDERFTASYVLQQKIETDIYGSDGLLVFRRAAP
jgi:arabinofuranosyltransferase